MCAHLMLFYFRCTVNSFYQGDSIGMGVAVIGRKEGWNSFPVKSSGCNRNDRVEGNLTNLTVFQNY